MASDKRNRLNLPAKVDYETFRYLVQQEVKKIPKAFLRGINGVFVEQKTFREKSGLPGLYVLGHYIPHYQPAGGAAVVVYYGSFCKIFRNADITKIKDEIARIIAHELLHHWEFNSGIDNLGDEDRAWLERWKRSTGRSSSSNLKQNLRSALIFIFVLMAAIVVAALLSGP